MPSSRLTHAGPYSGGQSTHRHPLLSTCMIPLKMRRLFFGFTPRRLLGINGSILAHCPSLNQNKFARICWPPDSVTNPLNLNMVNWVLTLVGERAAVVTATENASVPLTLPGKPSIAVLPFQNMS